MVLLSSGISCVLSTQGIATLLLSLMHKGENLSKPEDLTCMMVGSGRGQRTGSSRSGGSEGCSTATNFSEGLTPCGAATGLILCLPTLSSYNMVQPVQQVR